MSIKDLLVKCKTIYEWNTLVFILELEAPKGSFVKRETERESWLKALLKRSMVKGGWNCAHTKQAMTMPAWSMPSK